MESSEVYETVRLTPSTHPPGIPNRLSLEFALVNDLSLQFISAANLAAPIWQTMHSTAARQCVLQTKVALPLLQPAKAVLSIATRQCSSHTVALKVMVLLKFSLDCKRMPPFAAQFVRDLELSQSHTLKTNICRTLPGMLKVAQSCSKLEHNAACCLYILRQHKKTFHIKRVCLENQFA